MRRLVYIPIIHTMADMGSKAEALKQEWIRQFGVERWERHCRVVEEVWEGIRTRLLGLRLLWKQVQIYQDGLPVSGKELEIAREVAAQGGKNYRLVMELVGRGATLMGTESPELLMREYAHIKKITEATTDAEREEAKERYAAECAEILKSRDVFIANRIAESLKEDGMGLLFLGLRHEVDRLLPQDIQVEFLIDRLPLQEVEVY